MTIANAVRVAVLGVMLAGAAVPVQAASLQFGFGFGDGFGLHRPVICIELTDRQIRQAVRNRGYSNVYLNVANNHRIQVRATKGDWVYLLKVSTCTGTILERTKLRPA